MFNIKKRSAMFLAALSLVGTNSYGSTTNTGTDELSLIQTSQTQNVNDQGAVLAAALSQVQLVPAPAKVYTINSLPGDVLMSVLVSASSQETLESRLTQAFHEFLVAYPSDSRSFYNGEIQFFDKSRSSISISRALKIYTDSAYNAESLKYLSGDHSLKYFPKNSSLMHTFLRARDTHRASSLRTLRTVCKAWRNAIDVRGQNPSIKDAFLSHDFDLLDIASGLYSQGEWRIKQISVSNLDVAAVQLLGQLLRSLALPNLKALELMDCNMPTHVPSSFFDLVNLESLSIVNKSQNIKRFIVLPTLLPRFASLKRLDLSGHQLQELRFQNAEIMPSLEVLVLSTFYKGLLNLNITSEDFNIFPNLNLLHLVSMKINADGSIKSAPLPLHITRFLLALQKHRFHTTGLSEIDIVVDCKYF